MRRSGHRRVSGYPAGCSASCRAALYARLRARGGRGIERRCTVIRAGHVAQLDRYAGGEQAQPVLDAFVAQRIETVRLDERRRQAAEIFGAGRRRIGRRGATGRSPRRGSATTCPRAPDRVEAGRFDAPGASTVSRDGRRAPGSSGPGTRSSARCGRASSVSPPRSTHHPRCRPRPRVDRCRSRARPHAARPNTARRSSLRGQPGTDARVPADSRRSRRHSRG